MRSAVAREVPSSERSREHLDDLVGLLVDTGLATSKSDARRTLDGRGFRANGVVLDPDSRVADVDLLHGRFLLLRRGKRSHHLVDVR